MRRNPNYPRRRQLLPPITEKTASTPSIHSHISLNSLDSDTRTICEEDPQQQNKPKSHTDKDNNNSNKSTTTTICNKCRNNFKSCEFCNKNPSTILNSSLDAYNPVYNVREIRTVNHSFSPLGSDKKILDVEQFSRQQMKSNGVVYTKRYSACDYTGKMAATLAAEAVNNNPAKGLGHYVYIWMQRVRLLVVRKLSMCYFVAAPFHIRISNSFRISSDYSNQTIPLNSRRELSWTQH